MSVLKLKINTGRPATEMVTRYQSGKGPKAVVELLAQYLLGVSSGTELADPALLTAPSVNIVVQNNEVYASGTIIFSGASTANDTVLINGVTFTAVASGATGNQWNIGTTATEAAANLAAAIVGSATALVNTQVTAAAATGTLTITSLFPGYAGNAATIAKGVDAGPVMTVSGARLTAGAPDAAAVTLSF